MQKLYIFKGLPASGKTTKAKEMVAQSNGHIKRINKEDDMRVMVDSKFSKERESYILELRDSAILLAIKKGHSVIVDDTNLVPKHENRIRELASSANQDVEVIIDDSFCAISAKECIRRDALRPNPVGKSVIRRMARQFGIGQIPPYYIAGLPNCVICDLDGTLALMGDRDPFDASTCENDKVNYPVANYIFYLMEKRLPIFFFSGRQEKDRIPTWNWLERHGFTHNMSLMMRPDGNYEKDVIVKTAMFNEHIRGKYNVHVVLDDRNQVVEGWRNLGLICFQVADGDF